MANYNLDAIRRKIEDLSGGPKQGSKKTVERPKLKWFKPQIGEYNIRFLPYQDANGQPFQEVSYYDNKLLSEKRFVAPAQFGLEDPIFDLLNELRKDKSKETWRLIGTLRPRERFYAPLIVRGEEDQGVQIWELNSKILKDIYSILANPDYTDEDMMHPETGFDFLVKVTDSGKKWNNFVVKDFDIQARRKASPLLATKKAREELLATVPNLEQYFRSLVWGPDRLSQIVENFLASKETGTVTTSGDESLTTKTRGESSRGAGDNSAAVKNIEDAFADLDDDDLDSES